MAASGAPVTLRFRPRAVAKILALVVAGMVVLATAQASLGVLVSLAIASTIAMLLRPSVMALARRTRPGIAIAVVLVLTVVVAGGLTFGATMDLSNQSDRLADAVQAHVERVDPASSRGRFYTSGRLDEEVIRGIRELPSRLVFGSANASGALGRLARVFFIVCLSLMVLTRGRQLVLSGIDAIGSDDARRLTRRVVLEGYRRGTAYVRRTIALGILATGVGLAAGFVLDLPGFIALGVWVGVWSVVPIVGPIAGWAPVLAVAAITGRSSLAIAAVVAVSWVVLERELRRRWVVAPTVDVGALLTSFGLLVGWKVSGLPGAVVGLLVVAVLAGGLDSSHELVKEEIAESDAGVDETAPSREQRAVMARGPRREVTVDLSTSSAVWAVAMLVGLFVAGAFTVRQPYLLMIVVLSAALAAALNPVVDSLARRTGSRKVAVGVVFGGFVVLVASFGVFAVPRAVEQSRQISDDIPGLVADFGRLPVVGPAITESGADAKLEQALEQLPELLSNNSDRIEGVVDSAGDIAAVVFWILLLLMSMLLDAPRLLARVHDVIPARRQPRVERMADVAYRSFGRYWGGSATVASINGAVVMTIGLVAGVPLAPVLGAWSAMCSLIPQIGGFLGGSVFVLFAFTQGVTTGIVCGVLFLTYQTIENNVIQPIVIGKAVDLSALAATTVLLIGGAAGGFVGAMLATPLAGVVKILWRELRTGPADSVAPDAGPDPALAGEATA